MNPDEQIRGGEQPPRKILILGVGNLLLTDDGVGVHCIQSLRNVALPPNVSLLEAGTVGHQLLPQLHETDYLIVIDAVQAGDAPGSIFRFSPQDLKFKSGQMASLHQISLIDVLTMAAMTGKSPETIIIGVQPKDTTSWSLELSPEVKAVIPRVGELVLQEVEKIMR